MGDNETGDKSLDTDSKEYLIQGWFTISWYPEGHLEINVLKCYMYTLIPICLEVRFFVGANKLKVHLKLTTLQHHHEEFPRLRVPLQFSYSYSFIYQNILM